MGFYAPSQFAVADDAQIEMWGCAPVGERRNVLYLADWGARSYVKIQNQRVPATCRTQGSERRWDWGGGANTVVLSDDGLAHYYKGGDMENPQGTFRCKSMR